VNNPTSFVAARMQLERARELVTAIRANPGGPALNDALSQLEASLFAASSQLDAAQRQFDELSSVVVAGNVRHF